MYFGGKNGNGTRHSIINKIPPHKRYIELFLGSGAILNSKRPAEENYGVEINQKTIDRFSYASGAKIICANVFKWIRENQNLFDIDTFVYLDPPYPLGSRKSQKEVYEYELTDEQHSDIIKSIKSMTAMVAISTYPNELYAAELKDWNVFTFESMTRGGMATEYLYMNYPEPAALHDYNYLGKDFTDRQRIKRKISREVAKLSKLPPLERRAIIEAVNQVGKPDR